jgi:hypothetical protein
MSAKDGEAREVRLDRIGSMKRGEYEQRRCRMISVLPAQVHRISLKDSDTHPLVECKISQRVIDRSGVRSIDVVPPDSHVRHDRGHRQEGERGDVGENVSGHDVCRASLCCCFVLGKVKRVVRKDDVIEVGCEMREGSKSTALCRS